MPHHRANVVRIWFAFVICMSTFDWIGVHEKADHHETFAVYLVLTLAWAFTPLLFLLVARSLTIRYPFAASAWRKTLLVHAMAAIGLTMTAVAVRSVIVTLSPLPIPISNEQFSLAFEAVVYIVMVVLLELGRRTSHYRRLELTRAWKGVQVAEARRRRTEAELRALKAELNPHFLGNALASVAALLKTDVEAADRTLGQIGELLGRLGRRGAHEITLTEELEGLEPVLEYERLRLSGHLVIEREISSGAGDALVPDMILHPLVENAVKYGLAPHGGGTLRFAAERAGRDGDLLVVSVHHRTDSDVPTGEQRGVAHGSGIGLANVRSRVLKLYGSAASVELRTDGTRGIVAQVTLPWRDETAAPTTPGTDDESDGRSDPPLDARGSAGREKLLLRERLRGMRAGTFRVVMIVGSWSVLTWVLNALATRAAVRLNVPTDPIGTLVDAMLTSALRVGIAITAIELTRRFARAVTTSPTMHLHLLAAFGFGVIGTVEKIVMIMLRAPARMQAMPASHLVRNIAFEMMGEMLIYFGVVGAQSAMSALRRTRWSQASQLRLHQRLEEERQRRAAAELRTLQSELNPHFVGNALSAVSSLMHTDRDAALRVLEELGTLLRAALSRSATLEVTLREELATLRSFLEVEHARLGRRLDIHWLVEEGALEGRVPNMILQPLLENAVKHGLAPQGNVGRIDVEARRGDRGLELVVRDDGVGLSADWTPRASSTGRNGVGLANIGARLSELYGPIAQLELSRGDAGGTVARVRIPWHLDSLDGLDRGASGIGVAPTSRYAGQPT